MLFTPWQYIADWKCNTCGLCCKAYSVVLNFQEWLNIVKNYGVETTATGLNKLYLRRKSDGSCIFLYRLSNMYLCGLQHMKPIACKLWPFKILTSPKYGYAREAAYPYLGKTLYIYADSTCTGLQYGNPTWNFTNQTLKEFIEIAVGNRREQSKSTADISLTRQPTVIRRIF
ncbi:MAG: YkgJ family cysteine cluster protein [Nitrososphaerota archaeon]|nr:YkgJ family cysteine cluster protein [Nitrososphaerota archaeon]